MQSANITICSPFRDSGASINEYFDRLVELDYPIDNLRYVWVEGDSTDNTRAELQYVAKDDPEITLIRCDTGTPRYGSIVHPERFKALAQVFNAALDAVDLDWSTHVLFLPSDIHYSPDLLVRLLSHDKDIIAPLVWQNNIYYDTWASVRGGRNWLNFTRQWGKDNLGDQPIEMDRVGGTVLIKAEVLRAGCRYTPEEVDRGLCKMAKAVGFSCWIDPTTHVDHMSR